MIPVLNEAAGVGELLAGLATGFPDAERIVVDGGSTDGTARAVLRSGATLLIGGRGRAAQMNLGAAAARGRHLCFLHADTQPLFDAEALRAALGKHPWGFCRVRLLGRPLALRVIAAFMNGRARLTRIATGDQLLIVRRDLFETIGGFAPIPLMEDVEICKRLRCHCAPAALALMVVSSGRRWEQQGVLRTVLLMWSLRLAYWAGCAPERLWEYYYGARQPLRMIEPGRPT